MQGIMIFIIHIFFEILIQTWLEWLWLFLLQNLDSMYIIYSTVFRNGPPVEIGLVVTVPKKRRTESTYKFQMNAQKEDGTLNLDVGKGQYISLSDPKSLDNLNGEMENTSRTALTILQDQTKRLMDKLWK